MDVPCALNRVPITVMGRMCESHAVRSPFGKQQEEQRHCKVAAQIPSIDKVPKAVLHNSGSLAISFYVGNAGRFQIIWAAYAKLPKQMKTLFILRHAKSSWDDADLADFDRPLNERGKSAAPFIGEVMKHNALVPGLILASPAVRARETAKLVKEAAGLDAEIKHNERIYEASPQTLERIAASIDDRFGSAMIVGHNPGMEGFVRLLTGRMEPMPTAALAVVDLDISGWELIGSSAGKLRQIIRPKDEMKTFGKGS